MVLCGCSWRRPRRAQVGLPSRCLDHHTHTHTHPCGPTAVRFTRTYCKCFKHLPPLRITCCIRKLKVPFLLVMRGLCGYILWGMQAEELRVKLQAQAKAERELRQLYAKHEADYKRSEA